jgi:hypothetical protein
MYRTRSCGSVERYFGICRQGQPRGFLYRTNWLCKERVKAMHWHSGTWRLYLGGPRNGLWPSYPLTKLMFPCLSLVFPKKGPANILWYATTSSFQVLSICSFISAISDNTCPLLYQIFGVGVGLECGPLSVLRKIEEFQWKSRGSGLENWE